MKNHPAPTPVSRKPRIRRGYNPGIYFVDSRSRPGVIHMTMVGRYQHCTCEGFRHRGRCAHVTFCADYDRHLQALASAAA